MAWGTNTSRDTKPASGAFAITPSDSAELPEITRGLLVGGDGNVNAIFAEGTAAVLLTGLKAGVVYPFHLRKVLAASTTATSLVGLV